MMKLATLALLLTLLFTPAPMTAVAADRSARAKADRVIYGQVYFTNDSPERHDWRIELYTGDQRRRLRLTKTNRYGGFELKGLRPAVYLFHMYGPAGCLLRYRVDTRRRKGFRMTVVMDAACSGGNYLRDAVNGIN